MKDKIEGFLNIVRKRDGNEPEFMQAVEAVSYTHLTLPTTVQV